jgi:hypothetical protein
MSTYADPLSDRFCCEGIEQFASDADGLPAKQVEHFRFALQNDRYAGEEERAQVERKDGLAGVGEVARLLHGNPVELWDDEPQQTRPPIVPLVWSPANEAGDQKQSGNDCWRDPVPRPVVRFAVQKLLTSRGSTPHRVRRQLRP